MGLLFSFLFFFTHIPLPILTRLLAVCSFHTDSGPVKLIPTFLRAKSHWNPDSCQREVFVLHHLPKAGAIFFFSVGHYISLTSYVNCYAGTCLSSLPCSAKTEKGYKMQLNACGHTGSTAGRRWASRTWPWQKGNSTGLYLQVYLCPIVAQHFFIILISYQCFLDPFSAVLHQPGISCQPLWQGNVLN